MPNLGTLPAEVEATVGRLIVSHCIGVRARRRATVNLCPGLLQAEVQLPMLAQWQSVPYGRLARKNRRIRAFIIHRRRPNVRVLKDAVRKTCGNVVELPIELLEPILHPAAGAKK